MQNNNGYTDTYYRLSEWTRCYDQYISHTAIPDKRSITITWHNVNYSIPTSIYNSVHNAVTANKFKCICSAKNHSFINHNGDITSNAGTNNDSIINSNNIQSDHETYITNCNDLYKNLTNLVRTSCGAFLLKITYETVSYLPIYIKLLCDIDILYDIMHYTNHTLTSDLLKATLKPDLSFFSTSNQLNLCMQNSCNKMSISQSQYTKSSNDDNEYYRQHYHLHEIINHDDTNSWSTIDQVINSNGFIQITCDLNKFDVDVIFGSVALDRRFTNNQNYDCDDKSSTSLSQTETGDYNTRHHAALKSKSSNLNEINRCYKEKQQVYVAYTHDTQTLKTFTVRALFEKKQNAYKNCNCTKIKVVADAHTERNNINVSSSETKTEPNVLDDTDLSNSNNNSSFADNTKQKGTTRKEVKYKIRLPFIIVTCFGYQSMCKIASLSRKSIKVVVCKHVHCYPWIHAAKQSGYQYIFVHRDDVIWSTLNKPTDILPQNIVPQENQQQQNNVEMLQTNQQSSNSSSSNDNNEIMIIIISSGQTHAELHTQIKKSFVNIELVTCSTNSSSSSNNYSSSSNNVCEYTRPILLINYDSNIETEMLYMFIQNVYLQNTIFTIVATEYRYFHNSDYFYKNIELNNVLLPTNEDNDPLSTMTDLSQIRIRRTIFKLFGKFNMQDTSDIEPIPLSDESHRYRSGNKSSDSGNSLDSCKKWQLIFTNKCFQHKYIKDILRNMNATQPRTFVFSDGPYGINAINSSNSNNSGSSSCNNSTNNRNQLFSRRSRLMVAINEGSRYICCSHDGRKFCNSLFNTNLFKKRCTNCGRQVGSVVKSTETFGNLFILSEYKLIHGSHTTFTENSRYIIVCNECTDYIEFVLSPSIIPQWKVIFIAFGNDGDHADQFHYKAKRYNLMDAVDCELSKYKSLSKDDKNYIRNMLLCIAPFGWNHMCLLYTPNLTNELIIVFESIIESIILLHKGHTIPTGWCLHVLSSNNPVKCHAVLDQICIKNRNKFSNNKVNSTKVNNTKVNSTNDKTVTDYNSNNDCCGGLILTNANNKLLSAYKLNFVDVLCVHNDGNYQSIKNWPSFDEKLFTNIFFTYSSLYYYANCPLYYYSSSKILLKRWLHYATLQQISQCYYTHFGHIDTEESCQYGKVNKANTLVTDLAL